MPRPKRADRPVEKTINLPLSVVAKVDLILWSELEEKVPHGAWAGYVRALIEQDLERRAQTGGLK
jgi:hypothetical protein